MAGKGWSSGVTTIMDRWASMSARATASQIITNPFRLRIWPPVRPIRQFPFPYWTRGQVVQVQPARPAAGDVPEGRVPVHENLPPVVGLVDVQHHAPHGGGHVPHGASLLQVVQNLLQGGRRPGQLPPLVDRHLLGGVAHQDEVHAPARAGTRRPGRSGGRGPEALLPPWLPSRGSRLAWVVRIPGSPVPRRIGSPATRP